MFWRKKDKEIPYPKEEKDGIVYYVVRIEDVRHLDGYNVKLKGTVDGKPTLVYYATGFPWSISSRVIEEDHGHETTFNISGVPVIFRGIAIISKGEKVTVYGRVRNGVVEARIIETEKAIFKHA